MACYLDARQGVMYKRWPRFAPKPLPLRVGAPSSAPSPTQPPPLKRLRPRGTIARCIKPVLEPAVKDEPEREPDLEPAVEAELYSEPAVYDDTLSDLDALLGKARLPDLEPAVEEELDLEPAVNDETLPDFDVLLGKARLPDLQPAVGGELDLGPTVNDETLSDLDVRLGGVHPHAYANETSADRKKICELEYERDMLVEDFHAAALREQELERRLEEQRYKLNRKTAAEEVVMPVNRVRFTQNTISATFRDGRRFETLVHELLQGKRDPMTDGFLRMEAVRCQGKVFSLANRRLYCLKRYQQQVVDIVNVRLKVTALRHPLSDFLSKFTTDNRGRKVTIRARDH